MPGARVTGWVIVMRTCIIDDFIRCAIAEGIDTIVILGAGLDARPYRMDLPASVQWIEADYPHLIDYKERLLANEQPRCRLERVKIDPLPGRRRRARAPADPAAVAHESHDKALAFVRPKGTAGRDAQIRRLRAARASLTPIAFIDESGNSPMRTPNGVPSRRV